MAGLATCLTHILTERVRSSPHVAATCAFSRFGLAPIGGRAPPTLRLFE